MNVCLQTYRVANAILAIHRCFEDIFFSMAGLSFWQLISHAYWHTFPYVWHCAGAEPSTIHCTMKHAVDGPTTFHKLLKRRKASSISKHIEMTKKYCIFLS